MKREDLVTDAATKESGVALILISNINFLRLALMAAITSLQI